MAMNSNVESLYFKHAGLMVFCVQNVVTANIVKSKAVIAFSATAVTIKPPFSQAPFMSKPSFH
jgi:hypothetical protein